MQPGLSALALAAALFVTAGQGVHASPAAKAAKGKTESFIEITVNKGDTLTVIARRYLDDPKRWRELLRYNQIPRPNLILPGLKLKVPGYLARRPVATVVSYARSAEYSAEEKQLWAAVASDLGLYNRDRLRTDSTGTVALALPDLARLLVRENSYLVILDRKGSEGLGLLLQSGRMESLVTPDTKRKSSFRIVTPAAVVAVKGTTFSTAVDAQSNTAVACSGGTVAVSAAGKTVTLEAGFAVFVKKGFPPGRPFAILRPPQVEIGP